MLIAVALFKDPRWEQSSTRARGVLLYLYARADAAGKSWPSLTAIRKDMRVNRNTAIAAVKELEDLGLIARRTDAGVSTVYHITPVPREIPVPMEIPVPREIPVPMEIPVPREIPTSTYLDTTPVPREVHGTIQEQYKNNTSSVTQAEEQKEPVKLKRFVKPTVEQVKEFCIEKGYTVDADSFVDYYESKGWVVGKSPMKNWHAAVSNWARRDSSGNRNAKAPTQKKPVISTKAWGNWE